MASLPTRWTVQCLCLSILWIGLYCITGINAAGNFGDALGRLGNKQREFDFFKLSLLWPGTACSDTSHCCSSNACCHSSKALTEFTIHGLWGDYNDGTWPACCPGKRFDVKEVSTLLGAMNKYWPSLSCDAPSNCHGGKGLFWEHEWEKHGTCSSRVTGDEYGYFLTTLNLYFKYNVTQVLREAGYVASNTEKYPLGGIISAIQNAFHTTPELECSGNAVEELRLCFYKDFKLRDCGLVGSEKSCPKYVSLPEAVSSKLENNENGTSQSTLNSSM